MMTSTLTVVGREVFIDDYNEEIDNDYRLDPDEILQDMMELMEESPESYHSSRAPPTVAVAYH